MNRSFKFYGFFYEVPYANSDVLIKTNREIIRMKNRIRIALVVMLFAVSASGCAVGNKRDISLFKYGNTKCYDRSTEPYTSVVDSHIHFRPFGGPPVPFTELTEYFEKTDVFFANIYGIGQTVPVDSHCIYYPDCPGTEILPGIRNDFANAAQYLDKNAVNYLENRPEKVHMVLSMTSPDLDEPDNIVEMIDLYDKEYPNMFRWMGELNLVKQALFKNGHEPVAKESIKGWKDFMKLLKERDIPLNLHADLGNNCEPTKYLYLMKHVLKLYPENIIIWAHMGLSKELSKMNPSDHIRVMRTLLDEYPNLMLDLSWRVLYDEYFSKPEIRVFYVAFINEYSERILPGTDFVASRDKNFTVYKKELDITSRIYKYLNDEAFRNIALGGNYFRLLGLDLDYRPPQICNE